LGGYTDALFVKVMWHFWMQEEGVFGYWLSTSAHTLFLFVLFGAMLTSGGVGACFRKISFTQLGLLRSGPIKLIVVFVGISILAGLVYVLKTWVTGTFPGFTLPFVMLTMASVYLALRWVASKQPDLEGDDFGASLVKLPPAGVTAIACMSYLLPVVLLLWCILPAPYKLSAHLSAFYACIAMIVITLTQRPLKAIMRGTGELATECKIGVSDWVAGMIAGARNMIPITIAAAAAGVVIGAMTFFNRF
ncbi:MAG: hypothetical protein GY942_00960, partial [Aestuariibacter sp.]|nr:hypothetical protein [Aestuariibacter sp.]